MAKSSSQEAVETSILALVCLLVISLPVGWFSHIYHCFINSEWGFLIAGAIFFPIAWIHGLGALIGVW